MKHTWLVGILAGALLAGGAAVQAQTKPAAQAAAVPTGEVALGTITIPKAVTADGKPLASGRYQLRLTPQAAQPTVPGQLPDLNRWVEFVQAGQVKGREIVSIIPPAEVGQTLEGPDLKAGSAPKSGSRVDLLKGGDFMRVWISRQGTQYLIHLPVAGA
jgi:hypothetical protein